MIKKFLINRLLFYPVLWSFIWTFIFLKSPSFHLITLIKEGLYALTNTFPFSLTLETQFMLFGLVFGYVYGTISILLKARQIRGMLFFIVFFLKIMISMFFAITIGYLLYPIELILLPIILLLFRKYRKNKEKKKSENIAMVNQRNKEELLNEIREVMKEHKN